MTESELSKALSDLLKTYSDNSSKSIDIVARTVKALITVVSTVEELDVKEIDKIHQKIRELFDEHYQDGNSGVNPSIIKNLMITSCSREVAKMKYDLQEGQGK